MITMQIKHSDGDREINIHAETMRELIDHKLPGWIPMLEHELPMLQTTKRFKANPEKEEQIERESGWYYDV